MTEASGKGRPVRDRQLLSVLKKEAVFALDTTKDYANPEPSLHL